MSRVDASMLIQINCNKSVYRPSEAIFQSDNVELLESYKNLISKSIVYFGVESDRAAALTEQIFTIESDLHQVCEQESQSATVAQDEQISLQQLDQISSKIDWLSLMRDGLSSRNIFSHTTLVIHNKPYLMKLSQLLERESERDIKHFMMWRLVYKLAANLPEPISTATKELSRLTPGIGVVTSRWRHCTRDVSESLREIVSAQYVKSYCSPNKLFEVKTMVRKIQANFIKQLREINFLNNTEKQNIINKVEDMNIMAGYPQFILNQTYVHKITQNVTLSSNESYIQMQLKTIQNSLQLTRMSLRREFQIERLSSSLHRPEVYYVAENNMIHINAGMLQPPYFYDAVPRYMNFGSLGGLIAVEMIKVLWSLDNTVDVSKLLTYMATYPDNMNVTCLQDDVINATDLDTKRHSAAINLVLQTIKVQKTDEVLPLLGLDQTQLILVSLMQNYCTTGRYALAEQGINETLRDLVEKIFECKSKSAMPLAC